MLITCPEKLQGNKYYLRHNHFFITLLRTFSIDKIVDFLQHYVKIFT